MTQQIPLPETVSWSGKAGYQPEQTLMIAERMRRRLLHSRSAMFRSRVKPEDAIEQMGATCVFSTEDSEECRTRYLLEFGQGEALGLYTFGHGHAAIEVAAASADDAQRLVDEWMEALKAEPVVDDRVPVTFWTMSMHGPRPMSHRIDAPHWNEIATNYPATVQPHLEKVMAANRDGTQGIALWWGPPGTGKTTALRALAREWRDWCDLFVIVDPEVFLGEQASYLMDIVFGFGHEDPFADPEMLATMGMMQMDAGELGDRLVAVEHEAGVDMMSFDGDAMMVSSMGSVVGMPFAGAPRPRGPRAKLIVLEDAGELIAADARVAAGQALSRLLNMTDGMLGQGANISVLVTTNEQIEALHPAIQRPGRCWAQIEFPLLGVDEANAWLARHDLSRVVDQPVSLAELFSLARGDGDIALDAIVPESSGPSTFVHIS